MKLAYPQFDFCIESEENKANVLVIESPTFLRRVVSEIDSQIKTKVGSFVLSDDEILPFEKKAVIITNLFNLDLEQKKFTSKIITDLSLHAYDDENYTETVTFLSNSERYISEFILKSDIPLDYSVPSLEGILKVFNIKARAEGESLPEKLIDYLSLMNRVFSVNYFIIYSLHSLFTKDELKEFYRFAFLKKYDILSIEHTVGDKLDCEKYYIVDSDLCSII